MLVVAPSMQSCKTEEYTAQSLKFMTTHTYQLLYTLISQGENATAWLTVIESNDKVHSAKFSKEFSERSL